METRKIIAAGAILGCCLWMMFGCSVAGRLQRQQTTASLSQLTRAERQERQQDYRPQVVKLQRDSNTFYLTPVDMPVVILTSEADSAVPCRFPAAVKAGPRLMAQTE